MPQGKSAGKVKSMMTCFRNCTAAVFAALSLSSPAEPAVVPLPSQMRELGGICRSGKVAVVRDASLPPEGYRLSVTADGVEIKCSDGAGETYARQTLAQLKVGEDGGYSCVEIVDAPKYRWRGLMLDDARHFFGKEVVKAFLDRMVEHKFNIFHWHLVDDQGWRIEIRKHPELVEYGAKRPCSVKYGTHPSWPDGKLHFELNNEPYGPFYYTQDDIREILAYAKERHITVVPEIELPGHVRAMLAAHPEYSCVGEKLPRTPRVYWSIEDEVLCAGNDGGIKLLEEIFDEVCELFPDSPVIHIGGDECPKKRWKECPKCQARIKDLGLKDENALQAWLTTRFARYLEAKGRRVLGWDEILNGDVPSSAIGMSWRTARHGRSVMTAGEAARRGHDVVCTPNTFCYLDYTQDLKDDPYCYIGGCLPLKRCYWFDPAAGVEEKYRHRILGGQGNCWTEYTINRFDLEWKTWPRACAIAEVLWSGPERRDWDGFRRRLAVHRRRLVKSGLNCAPFDDDAEPMPENVPELMTTFDGRKVDCTEMWEKVRRPELKERFLEKFYGVRPAAAEKPEVSFSAEEPDREMIDGKAIRKRVRISYKGPYGSNSFVATAFIPKSERPVPAFLLICNRDPKLNLDPERKVKSGFWPVEEIVARGYAAIAFWNGDICKDNYNPSTTFLDGVFPCFERPQDRDDRSWAVLSAWAWGASRVMDWIETEPLLNAKRVAVVGHSRGGKTSLLAGVTDERFAMTCVNDSGCGGAKLAHIDLPESEHYNAFLRSRVTYWFCGAFQRYCVNKDTELEIDQHQWAALIAPRLLAIASASEDKWAGQPGEFHTARLASPAWELYGRKGLSGKVFPPCGVHLADGDVSYHMRSGKHDLTPTDWRLYMNFADSHGWNR